MWKLKAFSPLAYIANKKLVNINKSCHFFNVCYILDIKMSSFNPLNYPMRRVTILHKHVKSSFPKLGTKVVSKAFCYCHRQTFILKTEGLSSCGQLSDVRLKTKLDEP